MVQSRTLFIDCSETVVCMTGGDNCLGDGSVGSAAAGAAVGFLIADAGAFSLPSAGLMLIVLTRGGSDVFKSHKECAVSTCCGCMLMRSGADAGAALATAKRRTGDATAPSFRSKAAVHVVSRIDVICFTTSWK
jgi:hypothetical protein